MHRLSQLSIVAVAAALIGTLPSGPTQAETLTLVSWGGSMQEANRKAH
jgi:spermidine/putrescine-binding protein